MKKMRLLTFMQLAETHPEMTFQMIQDELRIGEADVEPFMIDGTDRIVKNNFFGVYMNFDN